MKISLHMIKEFTDVHRSFNELVEKIGAQLGAVDTVVNLGEKYQGIVIAKIVTCVKHPNADSLSLCTIDDGGNTPDVKRDDQGLVQVVCGAPNVHAGMLAAWLPPGTTVPVSYGKEPFVLEVREIRGVASNGMLASANELDISDDHSGIVEIDESAATPGQDFAELYGLNDHIIDIENKMFTHRPDLFGILGVAREIAGIQQQPFTSPEWYRQQPAFDEADNLPLSVHNELPELVPRFMAVALSDVQVQPSPLWLQIALMRVGLKAINNVVDITNYVMYLTGQPLHAFDYDKVAVRSGQDTTIVVRAPKSGESIALLNGKTIEPNERAVMIATDQELISVGGIMGGADTEVDASTKNIILECANFDMYTIRRTSMAHGLFTDAVTRFTKGQSPLQNPRVIAYAMQLLGEIAGAKQASSVADIVHSDAINVADDIWNGRAVKVSADFINQRLGLELSGQEITSLLKNVEFEVEQNNDQLLVHAPFWRTDIEQPEDVVEEIGRLHGYDALPLSLPVRDLAPAKRNPLFDMKTAIRHRLRLAGANEVLTYSFVHGNLLNKVGQDKAKAYEVANALSPDLQYYRLSLLPSLLEKIHPAVKAGYDEFALFELGKTHNQDHVDTDGLPQEFERTALVVAAADKLKKPGSAYYTARRYLEALTGTELSFAVPDESVLAQPAARLFAPGRSAVVSVKGGPLLGLIGEFKPAVSRALKLPQHTAGFEIDTMAAGPLLLTGPSYVPLSRFPSVKQDVTLRVAADHLFAEVYEVVDRALGAHAPDATHLRLNAVDIYQKPQDSHKHLTFRVTITGTNRTLTDKEVAQVIDAIAADAATALQAEKL